MVNGRRSTYRRKGRRGNRSLSTRRIFSNKGAKAQAAQIYALRKSVNRVRRQCKPEVKEVNTGFENRLLGRTFSGSGSPPTVVSAVLRTPTPVSGTADNQRIGDLIKLFPLKFRMTLQYREVYGTVEGSTVWNVPQLPTHGMQVRVVAIQSRASSSVAPTMQDILETYTGDTDSGYLSTMSHMTQQFKNGITARYHILYNKVFSISQDKPQIAKSVKIVPKIRSMRWEVDQTYPRGQIWIAFFQGGAVSRTIIADPDNLHDYNATNIMFKFTQPYTDA